MNSTESNQTTKSRERKIAAVLTLAAWLSLSSTSPSLALTSNDLLGQLQRYLPPRTPADLWLVGNTVIIVAQVQAQSPDASLAPLATTISHVVFSSAPSTIKQVEIIFTDYNSTSKSYRAFSIDANQESETQRAVQAGQSQALTVAPLVKGERASLNGTAIQVATITNDPRASMAALDAKRSALMVRIKYLQGRGVGVKPYYDQVTQIDQSVARSGPEAAAVSLGQLDRTIAEQEAALKAKTPEPTVAKASPVGGGSDFDDLMQQMADFQGSSKDFQQDLKKSLMQKEFGDLTVESGPFVVERARVARRIHELELQGHNVSSYKIMFRNIENSIDSKDSRKLGEVATNIKYLQSQLGVNDLR